MNSRHPGWLAPDWGATGVGALMTTREGGVSNAPFDSMNMGIRAGDDAAAVVRNREAFAAVIGATPVYLDQVHGNRVVRLKRSDARPAAPAVQADASATAEPGIACTVLVADCLPVLFAAPHGRAVGAAHAGWRGLAGGVLEATLGAVCDLAGCAGEEVQCWLGACIGPRRFEVGEDVLLAFGADPSAHRSPGFERLREGKWLADLALLARMRLRQAGVRAASGGGWCTFEDPARFYSFRRDRVTGRMAACVWIDQ